MVGKG
jgi:glutaredoxin 3